MSRKALSGGSVGRVVSKGLTLAQEGQLCSLGAFSFIDPDHKE